MGNHTQKDSFLSIIASQVMNDCKTGSDHHGVRSESKKNGEIDTLNAIAKDGVLHKLAKMESLLDLYSDLYRQSEQSKKIKVLREITREIFYEQYYFANRPVVVTSLMNNWPAMNKWSPEFFKSQFGEVPVEITTNREEESAYEVNFQRTVATVKFRDFIEEVISQKSSNNIYIVARNYFFSNPRFQSLREDVIPPEEIIDSSYEGTRNMKLWFGPKGTITPLHHDKHSILFAQIYGRKRFKMIPSFNLPDIYNTKGYYSEVDPDNIDLNQHPDFSKTTVMDLVLQPGDMLFIPVGWWHWVKSLDISMSVTFSSFYTPGFNTEWKCR